MDKYNYMMNVFETEELL